MATLSINKQTKRERDTHTQRQRERESATEIDMTASVLRRKKKIKNTPTVKQNAF